MKRLIAAAMRSTTFYLTQVLVKRSMDKISRVYVRVVNVLTVFLREELQGEELADQSDFCFIACCKSSLLWNGSH